MRTRLIKGLLILFGIAIFLEGFPFALLVFSYRRADITYSGGEDELTVGTSIALLGHVSNGDGGSELSPRIHASSDVWPPFRWLFRWSVETDSTAWDVFDATAYLVGEARISNGKLIGVKAGAVRVVLKVLGRRASQTFLVKPHGVDIAADRDSLVLEAGTTGDVVITATAKSGDIPAGYLPSRNVKDCSPTQETWAIGQIESAKRSPGRWVFPVIAHGRGQCTLVFDIAGREARVALTVTGKTKMERVYGR
jgi:hypothetical protein